MRWFGQSRLFFMAWVFYLLLAAGAVLWLGWSSGKLIHWSLFLAGDGWWKDVGVGVAAAAFLLGLWQLAVRFLPGGRRLEEHFLQLVEELDRAELLGLALLSGFAEELFFRGAVQGAWGWLPAVILFAALHTGPGREFRLWTLFAAAAGTVFSAVTVWRGNLGAAMVAHILVNAVNLLSKKEGRQTPPAEAAAESS